MEHHRPLPQILATSAAFALACFSRRRARGRWCLGIVSRFWPHTYASFDYCVGDARIVTPTRRQQIGISEVTGKPEIIWTSQRRRALTESGRSPRLWRSCKAIHQFCIGVLHERWFDFSRPWIWNEIVDFCLHGKPSTPCARTSHPPRNGNHRRHFGVHPVNTGLPLYGQWAGRVGHGDLFGSLQLH